MKLTTRAGQSLGSALRDAGVNNRDLRKAEAKIRKLNGLSRSAEIPAGTVLSFPDELKLGSRTVHFKKLLGDVASRGTAGTGPSGGQPMGALGIFAFDDLRNGGSLSGCGVSTPARTYSGCSVSSGCYVSRPRRRRTSACSVSSGCGPTSYVGCSVSSGCGTSRPRRRRTSACSVSSGCGPSTPYVGCSVSSGCGPSRPRRRRTYSGC